MISPVDVYVALWAAPNHIKRLCVVFMVSMNATTISANNAKAWLCYLSVSDRVVEYVMSGSFLGAL
jgi:hypothetical protein